MCFFTDGFSPFPSILTYFKDLSIHNFPRHWNIAQSLSHTSPSVIIDANTGAKQCRYVCINVLTCTYILVYFYVRSHVCMRVYTHVCIHVYVCAFIHACLRA